MVFRASWNCEENISEGVRCPQEPDPPAGVRKALRLRWKPPEERPAEGRSQRPPIKQRRCVAVCLWRAGRKPWSRFQTRLKTTYHKRLFTAAAGPRALGSRRVEEGRRSPRAEHAVPLPLQKPIALRCPGIPESASPAPRFFRATVSSFNGFQRNDTDPDPKVFDRFFFHFGRYAGDHAVPSACP